MSGNAASLRDAVVGLDRAVRRLRFSLWVSSVAAALALGFLIAYMILGRR